LLFGDDGMTTDTDRIEFLEGLKKRTVFINKKKPAYFPCTDIHISGPEHCSIYCRNEIGDIDFQGHGKTVREAIDETIANTIPTD
jgi:hypothetical protein